MTDEETPAPLESIPPVTPYPVHVRWRHALRRLWWTYRPDSEIMRYAASRDPRENEGFRVPATESVQYHCLWLTEFYTPSEAEGMLRRLEAMRASMTVAGSHDFAKFVREMRERPYGGGSHNIGYLVPKGSRRTFIGPDRLVTDLPRGVEHATASVMSMTPSLTALVIQFVFDDSVADEWLAPLNAYHRTRRVRRGGVAHYVGPRQLKPKAAAEARRRIRMRCAKWIDRHVPGYFSGLRGEDNHPAVEFVTLREQKPLATHGRLDDYLYGLDLYESFDTWVVEEHFRLRRGGLIEQDPRIAVLAGREDEVHAWGGWKDTGHGWNRSGLLIGLDDYNQFVPALAIDSLISSYEATLANIRDRLVEGTRRDTDATLSTLNLQLSRLSRGVQTIGPELVRMLDRPWFRRDLGDIKWHHSAHPNEPEPAELLTDFYRDRAEELSASERTVRELLVAGAQVAAAQEGIRLQRVSRLIAVLALVVAGLSLAAALATNWNAILNGVENLRRAITGFA